LLAKVFPAGSKSEGKKNKIPSAVSQAHKRKTEHKNAKQEQKKTDK
jgi:hypothetical protein